MRLHWFLPLPPTTAESAGRAVRLGRVRRLLGWIGPTWAASPLRRTVQLGALAAFGWLFFYVCWPYTARPARTWPNLLPVEVDAASGRVKLAAEQPVADPPALGAEVHVLDAGAGPDGSLGRFVVERTGGRELEVSPVEPLGPERLDRLSASFGPWSLSERDPGSWPSHYADSLRQKEIVPAELFLMLDPLASIAAAVAGRWWVGSLAAAGAILAVCLVVPRGFCGYLCPMGTLIDLFDWVIGIGRKRPSSPRRWWACTKYVLLAATLGAALGGVLVCGFVAPLPLVTRAFAFAATPLQLGLARDWHQVPTPGLGQVLSLGLLLLVLGLGLARPRFWCRYVCPTGALFSVANLFRLTERKVEPSCIGCGRCVRVCPFDAIRPDFTTRTADCTFCQTCGGACPTRAIKFVGRWDTRHRWRAPETTPQRHKTTPQPSVYSGASPLPVTGEVATGTGTGNPRTTQSSLTRAPSFASGKEEPSEQALSGQPSKTPVGRRGFLAAAVGLAAGATGGAGLAAVAKRLGSSSRGSATSPVVRPPGSVPEERFLQLCVRCGECFQACPNNVLQPVGPERGWESLWTPQVVADWSGCEPSCANCGRVCPTGAIRALPLEEKRAARMGLAVVNPETCLPHAGRGECRLCADECATAGYQAIEFVRVGTRMDPFGQPIEGTGYLAPVVVGERCVGCGLCQTRCRAVNVKVKGLLGESAVQVEAGPGKEDRLMQGSYAALRKQEERQKAEVQRRRLDASGSDNGYLPGFLER